MSQLTHHDAGGDEYPLTGIQKLSIVAAAEANNVFGLEAFGATKTDIENV